jgi:hypothetical protein
MRVYEWNGAWVVEFDEPDVELWGFENGVWLWVESENGLTLREVEPAKC